MGPKRSFRVAQQLFRVGLLFYSPPNGVVWYGIVSVFARLGSDRFGLDYRPGMIRSYRICLNPIDLDRIGLDPIGLDRTWYGPIGSNMFDFD